MQYTPHDCCAQQSTAQHSIVELWSCQSPKVPPQFWPKDKQFALCNFAFAISIFVAFKTPFFRSFFVFFGVLTFLGTKNVIAQTPVVASQRTPRHSGLKTSNLHCVVLQEPLGIIN